ncbi:MAG: GTP-binding protein [Bacillota bacterium]
MIVDVVLGFLGSGKTTFILNIMDMLLPREKLAVIVNEFGDIGIDGAVIGQKDTQVVELPSGCICCTLSRDLAGQVEMLAKNYAPQRLLIEPSGVATVRSLLQVLGSLRLERYLQELRIICIIDAVNFFSFYKQNRSYVESQMEAAGLIVINKSDLEIVEVVADIMSVALLYNQKAKIISTSFCKISLEDYYQAGQWLVDAPHHEELEHTHGTISQIPAIQDLEKMSFICNDSYLPYDFNLFLQSLKGEEFGQVLRAKGIVHLDQSGWVLFNLASGYVTVTPMQKGQSEGKMFVAGRYLRQEVMLSQLEKCKYRGT